MFLTKISVTAQNHTEMKIRIAISLCLVVLISLSAFARDLKFDKYSSKLRRFVSDVVFVVDHGDREKYAKRLPAKISVTYHATPAEKQLAGKKLAQFLDATSVEIVDGSDSKSEGETVADIQIYFGETTALQKEASKHGDQIQVGNGYVFWTWWDDDRVIEKAVVFIGTDRLSGKNLEDRLIEQLFGVFGLPSKSGEADNSCMTDDDNAVFTELQPLDLALLKFYYTHIPAGTKPAEAAEIVREKWGK